MSEAIETPAVALNASPPEPAPAEQIDALAAATAAYEAAVSVHEAAIAKVAERHEAVQAINDERDKALAELAQLDALAEISMEQLLVQVNLQKKVRTLDAQLGTAQDALTAAGEEQEQKERELRQAKVTAGDVRLQQMDQAYIDLVLDFAEKAAAQRAEAFALKRELETLETDFGAPEVVWNTGTPRGRFMLSVPESQPQPGTFPSNAIHDAYKLLVNLTEFAQRQDYAAQMEKAATTRGLYVYQPRTNEQLVADQSQMENR